MLLYHAGFSVIKEPDVHYGRKNADFGQGFYVTTDREFANRWARYRTGEETIVNTYELDTTGLEIYSFERTEAWFEYIYGNRRLQPSAVEADVVVGPIANDTIYDTFGIITSGFLKPEDAMKLLMLGPEYRQTAIKTEKAAKQLKWLSSRVLTPEEIEGYRATVAKEEEEYQRLVAAELENIVGGTST